MKKKKVPNKRNVKKIIIISLIVCSFILGSLVVGKIMLSKQKETEKEMMSYLDAKEKSQKMALQSEQDKVDKIRQQFNNFQNSESIKNENIRKQLAKELKEKIKSELYKQYEKLSKEEKDKIDAIPREEEIPMDALDDIIKDQEQVKIPSKFSLQDVINIKVEDQGQRGLCWDFAAMKSLETHIALHEKKNYDFSEQHVNYIMSNLLYYGYRPIDSGGNFEIFNSYLAVSGVVLEKDVPYEKDYDEKTYSTFIDMEPVKIVTETVDFPTIEKDPMMSINLSSEEEIQVFRETIKRHIMQDGSVFAAINAYSNNPENPQYYFQDKDSVNKGFPNHAISIVGWDDSISKENFRDGEIVPQHDGAYIALNSWGKEAYTDKNGSPTGYFYISYDDIYVETEMSGIKSTEFNESTTIKLDDIKSKSIKNTIYNQYYYGVKEKKNKQYLTKTLMNEIHFLSIKDEDDFDLNILKYFPNLIQLEIMNSHLKSIDNLPVLNKLHVINLDNNELENIDKLADCSKLIDIQASNNKIKDVSKLQNLKLQIFNVSNNKGIQGFEKLNSNNMTLDDIDATELKPFENEIHSLSIQNNQLESFNNIPTTVMYLDVTNNHISDLSALRSYDQLSTIILSKNPITDLSVFMEESTEVDNGMLESSNIYNPGLTMIFENSELDDITMFNHVNVSMLQLKGNHFTSVDGFEPGSDLIELILDDNLIGQIDNLALNDNMRRLSIQNNQISDVSNFDIKNLQSINLSGNQNITGYGNLNVQNLLLENCNLSNLETLSNTLTTLNISGNNLTDISALSSVSNLNTLWLEKNQEEITGSLNSNIEYLYIDDSNFSEDFNWECNNINVVYTSNPNFNKEIVKDQGMIGYYGVEITPSNFSSFFDEKHYTFFTNSKMTISLNKSGNMVDISKEPFIKETYRYFDQAVETENVAVSKDRNYFIIFDSSITELNERMIVTDGENTAYSVDVTVEINKSLNLLNSIQNLFKKIFIKVSKLFI